MQISQINNVTILKAQKSDLEHLTDEIDHLLDNDNKKIVIDLADIDWIDSQGLGRILNFFNQVKNAGGECKFSNPTERVKILFNISNLEGMLPVFGSTEEAVESFSN